VIKKKTSPDRNGTGAWVDSKGLVGLVRSKY